MSATTPQRIQLSRARGWKMPENTVRVARPGLFSNPFRIGQPSGYQFKDDGDPAPMIASLSREQCVEFYRELATGHIFPEMHPWGHDWHKHLVDKIGGSPFDWIRSELRGKNVGCWCSLDEACHGDVHLELWNR